MTARLFAVDPANLPVVWPHVAAEVENIAARSRGRMLASDIREMIETGERVLWVAVEQDNGALLGLAMTEIHQYPRRKACRLVACTGRERTKWLNLLGGIEGWAKAEGCDVIESFARKGWSRELPDYFMSHCFLEKDI